MSYLFIKKKEIFMKKIKLLSLLLASSLLPLTSCGGTPGSSPVSSPVSPTTPITTGPNSSSTSNPIEIPKGKSTQSNYQSVMTEAGTYVIPSTGEPNILVIPVDFSDFTCSSLKGGCEGSKATIQDGFFGERTSEDTVESLTSFYKKSSYGKLNIKGYVADWYRAPNSATSIATKSSEEFLEYIDNSIIKPALNNLISKGVDISKFDTDGDEVIDGIWLVYSLSYDSEKSGVNDSDGNFWAYTYWSYLEDRFSNVYTGTYAWASFDFFNDGGYTDHPDMHTFIHESGHMMGLQDYYSYDASETGTPMMCPAGGLDMMDYNVGDHMAYSKFLLGWIEPRQASKTGEFTLTPYATTGDAIVIAPSSYFGEANWEYLIIEYYTPTNLFKYDSEHDYTQGDRFYTESGLRVYHIDSRLGLLQYNETSSEITMSKLISDFGTTLDSALNQIADSNNETIALVASNTPSYVYGTLGANGTLNEAELVSETFDGNRLGTNSDLYKVGESLERTSFAWHTGETSNIKIEVTSATESEMKVTITL